MQEDQIFIHIIVRVYAVSFILNRSVDKQIKEITLTCEPCSNFGHKKDRCLKLDCNIIHFIDCSFNAEGTYNSVKCIET